MWKKLDIILKVLYLSSSKLVILIFIHDIGRLNRAWKLLFDRKGIRKKDGIYG